MTAPRLFRRALDVLPPCIGDAERDEIAATFAALWRDAATPARRIRVLLTCFGRLPVLAVLEWKDYLSRRRAATWRKGDRMHGWESAVRHSARSLARTPSFTWSVVLLLGLGVGAVTTIFSVVDHVVLRPLPYPAADRLVKVLPSSHSGLTFQRLATMGTVESLAGVATEEVNLAGAEEPVRLREARVTRDFLTIFGAHPALGRLLVSSDFETVDAVLLSHGTWRRVFGGDSSVVGLTVRIDGVPRVVVGVLDASFVAPEGLEGGADVWRPVSWSEEMFNDDNYYILSVALRLRQGVTPEQAQAEADAVAAQRANVQPDRFLHDGRPSPLTLVPLQEATAGAARPGLLLMLAAVTVLLLVACVNVALLFLARGLERVREMSIRRALGAGAAVIARHLAVESVLVGVAGAALGVALTVAALSAFHALAPGSLPRMDAVAVDTRVLTFAVAVGTLTALAFGLLPALRLALGTGENPLHLRTRGSTSTRASHSARHALVVAEIALSLVLAAQAGWLIQGFAELQAVDLGFRTEDIWTLPLTLSDIEEPAEFVRRVEGIRESLETVPGVRAATFGLTAPLEFTGGGRCCWHIRPGFPGHGEKERSTVAHPVDAGYFELFGLRLAAGRAWTPAETAAGRRPVVLSEPLALDVFGSASAAIGQALAAGFTTYTIVGVVADNRHYGHRHEHGFAAYIPLSTMLFAPGRITMAVRVEGEQAGIQRALARAVWQAESDLAVPTVRSMEDWAAAATARDRFVSTLFTVFGAAAVALMAGGLAGTLLYNVRTRRREFGMRLALGATPANIEVSVLRRGLYLALTGIMLGGVGAWMAGRAMEALAAGMEARGAGTFTASVAVVLAVALLSSWLPARRAGKADPMETLWVE